MCRITQTPFFFAACGHLCVLSTVETCDEIDHPNGLPLYCGPAEWKLVTTTQLETLAFRCKNCRPGTGGASAPETDVSTPKLVCLMDADEPIMQDTPIRPATIQKPRVIKGKLTQLSLKEAADAPAQDDEPADAWAPDGETEVGAEQQVSGMTGDVENLEAKAAKYGVSVEEYMEVCALQLGICNDMQNKRADIWEETAEVA